MKIGILTHYLHFGYGGVLQNYALQTVLKQLGHEPITMRTAPVRNKCNLASLKSWCSRIWHMIRGVDSGITEKQDILISRKVEQFISTHINCTKPLRKDNEFSKAILKYNLEAVIVGSDQVWRNNYEYVDTCFLNFAHDYSIKKIGYAISFGVDDWRFSKKKTVLYRSLSKQFNHISVREDSGIRLCREYLNLGNVELVLDPTLLIDKEKYIEIIEEANEPVSDGNLFTYILDKSNEKESIINTITSHYDLTRFECMPMCASTYNNVRNSPADCIYPPITKWLRSFMDAELVITDSFHGTAFAIIFNKPFYVIINKERGAARFISLLKLFALEDRIIDSESFIDGFKKSIDWSFVNSKKRELREQSIDFIKNSLNH